MDKKALLKELIKDKGIVIPEKPVKLSGGGESLYYYDIKKQGKSILETVDKIVKQRREVVGVIAIVDREEGINEEQLRDRNIELFRIFRHSDFRDFIDQQLKTSSAKTEAYQSV